MGWVVCGGVDGVILIISIISILCGSEPHFF